MAKSSAVPVGSVSGFIHMIKPNFKNMSIVAVVGFIKNLIKTEVLDRIQIGEALYRISRVFNDVQFLQIVTCADLRPGQARFYINIFKKLAHAGPALTRFAPGALRFLCRVSVSQKICNEAVLMVKSGKKVSLRDAEKIYCKYHPAKKFKKSEGLRRDICWRVVQGPHSTGIVLKFNIGKKYKSVEMKLASGKGFKPAVEASLISRGREVKALANPTFGQLMKLFAGKRLN